MTTPDTPDLNPARRLDLDAAREARAAARGEAPILRIDGQDYRLPVELPARFLDAIAVDDLAGAFGALFDGSGIDLGQFLDSASYDDLVFIAEGIAPIYGIEGGLGNLRTSGASSSATTKL